MAENTAISWTDNTFNPRWGCTKVGPGCDNCYASAFDKRTGGNFFNGTVEPRVTSFGNWKKPIRWNKEALRTGKRIKVFCGSMCDVFDATGNQSWRDRLWELIRNTPMLDWQLLTKRPENIVSMLPNDWGSKGYPNVWLGVTCENKKHGYPRIDILRFIPAKIRFISAEPLLEGDMDDIYLDGIDWVIVGGESGPGCRKMEKDWAKTLIDTCEDQNTPVFFKQWGGNTKDKGGCLIYGREHKEWPHPNNG